MEHTMDCATGWEGECDCPVMLARECARMREELEETQRAAAEAIAIANEAVRQRDEARAVAGELYHQVCSITGNQVWSDEMLRRVPWLSFSPNFVPTDGEVFALPKPHLHPTVEGDTSMPSFSCEEGNITKD